MSPLSPVHSFRRLIAILAVAYSVSLLNFPIAAAAAASVPSPPIAAAGSSAIQRPSTTSTTSAASTTAESTKHTNTKSPQYVIGIDGGTESIRAAIFDASTGRIVGKPCAVPYKTTHPQPGWAEQRPRDWYDALGRAVRGALTSNDSLDYDDDEQPRTVNVVRDNIRAICLDTTCCSVVALDEDMEPLRPCLLWMDARSASQSSQILSDCHGDPALRINGDGDGPISAEWMIPKALWISQNEPDVWRRAQVICEYQDYINYQLTGVMTASSCNAATRWHWHGDKCLLPPSHSKDATDEERYPGRPMSLYRKLGIPDLAEKLPQQCLPMGSLIGNGLTPSAAKHLTLPINTPVVQGGPDAFVGMIGLGCVNPGQLCLITGSSHLHCVVTDRVTTARGTWGAYRGAPLPGLNFAEGGQSSTGSVLRWARSNLFGGSNDNSDGDGVPGYAQLDADASQIPPGSDGLTALETFQGSRTPITDPRARGALVGLTLSHTRSHIWRALLEAVCYGTKSCVDALECAGHACEEIVLAGGVARSELWLKLHADVTGKRVVVRENSEAPLLGCAVLAALGVGLYDDVDEAVQAMVRTARKIEPDAESTKTYEELFKEGYGKVGDAVRPVVHALATLRGGDSSISISSSRDGGNAAGDNNAIGQEGKRKRTVVVSPSLLACDWSDIRSEIQLCVDADARQLHVDVFDGVFLDSPYALTFGPQMVRAMRSAADGNRRCWLDVHLCVERPARYVLPLAEAGADRLIFQWEALGGSNEEEGGEVMTNKKRLKNAVQLAEDVIASGMKCGLSLNPATDVEEVYSLLETGLVDLVDVLAVEPGFGGQSFQEGALEKLRKLRDWRDDRPSIFGIDGSGLLLMVDGGINVDTAPRAIDVGADVLVAGTFLFRHREGLKAGVQSLL